MIWRELKPTYGDAVALRRAKARWADVRNNVTGSHVGSVGHLLVGGHEPGGRPVNINPATGQAAPDGLSSTPFGLLRGGVADGAVAYRQLHESNNPYDPKFEWRTSPDPKGNATVGPLLPVDAKSGNNATPGSIVKPQQPKFY